MTTDEILEGMSLDVDDINEALEAMQQAQPTLRDRFAMAALQGMLAYSYVNPMRGNFHENCTVDDAAKQAYAYADAMLAARQPGTSSEP